MENKKEKQILKIIKYTPPLFIVLASLCITLFLYLDNKNTFVKEKARIEQQFISEKKKLIKEEVDRVHNYISYVQKTTERELKKSIKSRVYEVHTLATSIYEKYKDIKSKEEIFQIIKTAVSHIRYNDGRGYFFFDNIEGRKVIYPLDKNIEGKIFYDFEDAKGYKFVQTIVKTIKEKTERFDEYYWYKPNKGSEISYRKISFYKYFAPLNLAIGTGEYFDDFEKIMQQKALEYINMIRYGDNGYIFVIDYNSVYLSHIRKNYIGKNAISNNDTVGIKKVITDLIALSKKDGGYYSYIQNHKPDTNLPTKKISYVRGLNDWQWMIGTGFYEDDALKSIQERKKIIDQKFDSYVKNIFIISFVLTLILLFISIYISRTLEKKFSDYKIDINKKQSLLFQQSKMAAMGEMIGNIAHQWRQPLSIITTASSGMVLQKKVDALSDENFYESTERINKSAHYLSKTIDDFRNFFSPDKVKTRFNVKSSFDMVFDLLEAQFNSKSIFIIKDIDDIEISTYENELTQALINILNNARDELIKKDYERFIFVEVKKKDEKLHIYIKDNAGGIKEHILNRIFEPYFTTKHKSQGTGIGLYMTEEIICKHMKGELLVKNVDFVHNEKNEKGALFEIILPFE